MVTTKRTSLIPTELVETEQTMFAEGRRYLANGKETIQKAGIIAYRAALKAMDGYLLKRGVEQERLPKSIEEY
jgi:hypothetical protein